MTIITCIVMSQAILRDEKFLEDEEDEKNFEELHSLFATNYLIIKEFAIYIVEQMVFADDAEKTTNLLIFRKKRPSISNRFISASGKKQLT